MVPVPSGAAIQISGVLSADLVPFDSISVGLEAAPRISWACQNQCWDRLLALLAAWVAGSQQAELKEVVCCNFERIQRRGTGY